ncbi:MAG TPA: bifunctional metallophosphatase/5'-nucleotidase [Alphaproteobacteria bacterium]|nr:bifunctional metallophosphatase/5'-nucleotidase [Alphaproteobacteria bacterium]
MISFIKRAAILPLMALSITAHAQQNTSTEYTLTIIHNNDVHARLDQVTMSGSSCTTKDAEAQKCYGGFARMAGMINQIRQQKATLPLLVLNAGDFFQGSLFYTYYKSAALWPFVNYIKFDAVTLGNHEFDNGVAELVQFLNNSKDLNMVVANINTQQEPNLNKFIKKSLVINQKGEKIGIIGLITVDTPILSSPGSTVTFQELKNSLETEVKVLEAQGVNKIIALTHIGLAEDIKLAETVRGVDVYIGGHSHSLQSNQRKEAVAPYPIVVKTPSGDPALVAQAYYAGIYLGNLEVTFNDKGVPVRWQGEPILLDHTVPQDQQVLSMVKELSEPLQVFRQRQVGTTETELVGSREICRHQECNLGNLISDALLFATQKQKTQIAFQNGGGIRTSIPKGPINYGQILEVLPFSNSVSVFGLKGSDVKLALENGVSRAESTTNEGTGRFLQVSGLRYSWDATKPVGSRILSIEVKTANGQFVLLDEQATYVVVTNDFLRAGGDGFSVFKEKAINPIDNGMNLEEALSSYIQHLLDNKTLVSPAVEGRIKRQN